MVPAESGYTIAFQPSVEAINVTLRIARVMTSNLARKLPTLQLHLHSRALAQE
jgi:hypothetical protein